MRKFKIGTSVAVTLMTVTLFFACNKEVESKASYIFKPAPSNGAMFKVGEEIINEAEFNKGIESDLYEAEMKVYEIKFGRLQGMLLEKFMNQDPQKKGLSNDEYLDKYIAKDIKVSDKDIEKFIVDRQVPKDQVNPEIKERIKQYIEMEKKKEAVDKWLGEKITKAKVEVYLKKPERPTFKVDVVAAPIKGNKDAKVTIVEYSDFQCPFCAKATKVVEEIQKKYGSKVKIAFKHFPLPFHNQARLASEASLCANEQSSNLFWKMHDAMFADQTKLDRQNLIATAKKVGVKEDMFVKCLDSKKYSANVDTDVAEGQELSIKSTPTFFVNGKLITGAQPLEVFSEVIDEELAK